MLIAFTRLIVSPFTNTVSPLKKGVQAIQPMTTTPVIRLVHRWRHMQGTAMFKGCHCHSFTSSVIFIKKKSQLNIKS